MKTDRAWRFAAVVIEKRKVNPVLRHPETFYPKFATPLLRFVFRGCVKPDTDQIVVCTDSLPTKRKDGVTKALKHVCASELKTKRVWLYHHPRHSNKWIQIADYCAWGLQRKWERSDVRTYDDLKGHLTKPELNLCAWGDQSNYY
jgi:hypothetical protein